MWPVMPRATFSLGVVRVPTRQVRLRGSSENVVPWRVTSVVSARPRLPQLLLALFPLRQQQQQLQRLQTTTTVYLTQVQLTFTRLVLSSCHGYLVTDDSVNF